MTMVIDNKAVFVLGADDDKLFRHGEIPVLGGCGAGNAGGEKGDHADAIYDVHILLIADGLRPALFLHNVGMDGVDEISPTPNVFSTYAPPRRRGPSSPPPRWTGRGAFSHGAG